eukprot:gene58163-biopygen101781
MNVANRVFNDPLGDLDACKAKCISFGDQCGYVVSGWIGGDTMEDWCGIQKPGDCDVPLVAGHEDCGAAGGDNGVHTYVYVPHLRSRSPTAAPTVH